MNPFLKSLIAFLIINFGGIAIGGLFTGTGVSSDWYANLNKAPWTPPGWVFGAAWTLIMVCFSFYMAGLYGKIGNAVIPLFVVAVLLNVAWNPIFFYQQWVLFGLIVISTLTIVIGIFLFKYWGQMGLKSILILPYIIWLCIATSLNAYVLLNN